MKKLPFFAIIFFFLVTNCKNTKNTSLLINKVDEIRAYRISIYINYFGDVPCKDIKTKRDVNIVKITDKEKIRDFIGVFEDTNNFIVDSTQKSIDARILFEYMQNGVVIETICWSKFGLIYRNGNFLQGNSEVNKYLENQSLIYPFTVKLKKGYEKR